MTQQIHNRIVSVPTQTSLVRYVKGENTLSFHVGDKLQIISSDVPYFQLIVDAIENNPELLSTPTEKLVYETTEDGVTDSSGRLWYKGHVFPVGSAQLVQRVQESSMPLEPVLAFLEKAQQSPAYRDLVAMVCSKEIEITWTGDLVLYTRAAWGTKPINWETWIDEDTVQIGHVQRFSIPARAGTFEYISKQCPDQGSIFEALVNPADVERVSEFLYVTGYAMLSKLSEESSAANYGISMVYRQTEDAGVVLVRAPYNSETARNYLSSCLQGVKTTPVEATELSGSC